MADLLLCQQSAALCAFKDVISANFNHWRFIYLELMLYMLVRLHMLFLLRLWPFLKPSFFSVIASLCSLPMNLKYLTITISIVFDIPLNVF